MRHVSTLAAVLLVTGCGGSTASSPAPAQPSADAARAGQAASTGELPSIEERIRRACTHAVDELHCPSYGTSVEDCVAQSRTAYGSVRASHRPIFERLFQCTAELDSCAASERCVEEARAHAASLPADRDDEVTYGTCHDESDTAYAPVLLGEAEASARLGLGAARFSEVTSSKERPVEVCGVRGQLEWLTRVTCDDGTNPFADLRAAHLARAGAVGPGGRCGRIIDRYQVSCPEQTYTIFMDAYACAPGESFR